MGDPIDRKGIGTAIHELMSVRSALHMPPNPKPDNEMPNEPCGFMDEEDYMVEHASEHAHQAIKNLQINTRRIERHIRRYMRFYKSRENSIDLWESLIANKIVNLFYDGSIK